MLVSKTDPMIEATKTEANHVLGTISTRRVEPINDSCHSRCIGINNIYILNPIVIAELLQYSGSRVEHGDGFSLYK